MLYTFAHSAHFLNQQSIINEIINQPEWTIHTHHTVREILSQLSTIPQPFYTFFYSAGTRILYPLAHSPGGFTSDQTIERFSGRRIRLWHVFVNNNQVKLQLGSLKFSILNKQDREICKLLLEKDPSNFWFGSGCQYINSCYGAIFPHKKLEIYKTI